MSETNRLEILRSLDVMDTAPEPAFDRIVELARRELGMPMALVTLLDDTRQWCKAQRGIKDANVNRNIAFCDYTIRQQEVMIINDAKKDERFVNNPLVTGAPWLRFYAGAPLTMDGERLGALCVLDIKPRTMTDGQALLLDELSDVVVGLLEGRRAKRILEQRNAELLSIAESLAVKNDAMEHFASLAAHDLRAPLRTIISFMDLLEREHGAALGGDGLELVQYAQRGAKELADLTASMLKFARTGSVDVVEVDLQQVVADVQRQLQVQIGACGAAIHAQGLPCIEGDKDGMTRVMLNLVSNAISYRASDRQPVINISASTAASTTRVVVSDNGIGIGPDRRELVFQAFERGNSSKGAGLGLFVCKRLLEAQGGTLTLLPSDVGATFEMSLRALP